MSAIEYIGGDKLLYDWVKANEIKVVNLEKLQYKDWSWGRENILY